MNPSTKLIKPDTSNNFPRRNVQGPYSIFVASPTNRHIPVDTWISLAESRSNIINRCCNLARTQIKQ